VAATCIERFAGVITVNSPAWGCVALSPWRCDWRDPRALAIGKALGRLVGVCKSGMVIRCRAGDSNNGSGSFVHNRQEDPTPASSARLNVPSSHNNLSKTITRVVFLLEQVLGHGTPRGLIVCSDASSPSPVTLSVLCSPFVPSFSPTDFASKSNNTLLPSICQHVFSLRPHFCVRRRTAALAHGIATQVVSGQMLCH
jgi:hypothetical protein